jgi:DNA replication protein DnaC
MRRLFQVSTLRHDATVEDLDYRIPRGLSRPQTLSLAQGSWIERHHNCSVVGPTGVGKTYVACALARAGIQRGHRALYLRVPRMLEMLSIARDDGRLASLMATPSRVDIVTSRHRDSRRFLDATPHP